MKSVDLNKNSVKILGPYYSFDKELQQNKSFVEHISKIQDVLKSYRIRQFSIEGRTVFKSFAISMIIYQAMLTSIHETTTDQVEKI